MGKDSMKFMHTYQEMCIRDRYCAALFGTSALVESVFSIQGLGIYLIDSCESMDSYGISGSILVCGVLFVLFNTLADLLSSAICPAYRRKAV